MNCKICGTDTYIWEKQQCRIYDYSALAVHRDRIHPESVRAARDRAAQTLRDKRAREAAVRKAAREIEPRPNCVIGQDWGIPTFSPIAKAFQFSDDSRPIYRLTVAQQVELDGLDALIADLQAQRESLAAEWHRAGGVIVTRDPSNPARGNLSYNRMQVLGPHTFGMNINEWRDVRGFLNQVEPRGQPLPVAVAIGLDPVIMIAGGCKYDGDELALAGALRRHPIPVTRGVTQDLRIPADAEIVIEGYIPPGVQHDEGPLAEFHGYYGEIWKSPTFEVTAICHRDNPVFQTIIPGWSEHIFIGNVLPREPLLLRFVRHASKNVQGLHIPPYMNGFTVVVQINKSNPGEPRNVAMAAFTAHVNIRVCIVVDADVDIYDPADVLWALTSRVDWGRDVFMVPGAQGHEMDPANDARGVGTKLGIDATEKGRREYLGRVRYNPVDLARYLGPA